jgi:sugar lactone lactonase YvrE
MLRKSVLIACLVVTAAVFTNASVFNGKADLVLGQADFTHNDSPLVKAAGMNRTEGVAVDTTTKRIYICDNSNNRVLWWNNIDSLTNGKNADGVLGQQDFVSNDSSCSPAGLNQPCGVCVDGEGNLWVADTGNDRILKYNAPLTSGQEASIVLGQTDMYSTGGLCSKSGLYAPFTVHVDRNGDVWVADTSNHRVLKFIKPSTSGQEASIVLGQQDFDSNGHSWTQSTMFNPISVAVDTAGNVWVADTENRRILGYSVPISSGMKASVVLGQTNFTSNTLACSQHNLNYPYEISLDASGNLWAADTNNNRILEFTVPITTGMNARVVLGQADFNSSSSGCSGTEMNNPRAICLDGSGNIYASDLYNNRVVRFSAPVSSGMAASLVLGQKNFTDNNANMTDGISMSFPCRIAINQTNGKIYVCDESNNRILWWNSVSSLENGAKADGVLGQPDFNSNGSSSSATGMSYPYGVTVDPSGNVWVGDYNNNRVLRFSNPIENGQAADLVLGQTNFGSHGFDCTNSLMNGPETISFDSSGNAWVNDYGNSRILKFVPPFTSGMDASLVLGQEDFDHGAGATAQDRLYEPEGMFIDSSNNIWVVDSSNNRILKFVPPFANGMDASIVIGQPGFDTSDDICVSTGTSYPCGASVDDLGNVWVADYGNNRVLKFSAPISSGMAASLVLGQKDFTSSGNKCSDENMSNPYDVVLDLSGNVWVADAGNNRVLKFNSLRTAAVPVSSATVITVDSPKAKIEVSVPAGTFSSSVNLTVSVPSLIPQSGQAGLLQSAIALEITNDLNLQPEKDITITLTYGDASLGDLDESKLSIAYYDTVSLRWVVIPSVVYASENKIVGTVRHLSIFSIVQLTAAADLTGVFVYPNPYRPGSGTAYDNPLMGNGVIFGALTANAKIRIYTIAGELVKELTVTGGSGEKLWDTLNKDGEKVASGVYIYMVTNPDNSAMKAKGKFAIIR